MCIKGFKGTSEEKIDHCNPQMITCLTAHCEKAPGNETTINFFGGTDRKESSFIPHINHKFPKSPYS